MKKLVATGALILSSSLPSYAANVLKFSNTRVVSTHSFWMSMDLTINDDGKEIAFIKTSDKDTLAGFTGTAIIVCRDKVKNIISVQQTASYGVNGEGIPGQKSERTDKWDAQLSPKVAKTVASVEVVFLQDGPPAKQRAEDTSKQIAAEAKWVARAAGAVIAVFK